MLMGDYQANIRNWITAATTEKRYAPTDKETGVLAMVHDATHDEVANVVLANVGITVLVLRSMLKVRRNHDVERPPPLTELGDTARA